MNVTRRPRNAPSRPLIALLLCAVAVTAIPMIAGLVQTRRIAHLVVEGEVSRWRDEVGDALRGTATPTVDALARVIASHREEGLRYLALYSHDGRLLVEAGASVTLPSSTCRSESGDGYVLVRDRVRACGGPLRTRPIDRPRVEGPSLPGGPLMPGGPILFGAAPQMADVPARYLPTTLFEVEARATRDLERAQAGLIAAGVAAVLAMLALGAFATRLLADRDAMLERLAQARHLSSLGEMSAVLAHEIRNPLASLKGHAQLLSERLSTDARLGPRVERIVTDATRLERLVDELLRFARTGDLDRREVRPAHWVRGIVAAIDHPGVHVVIDHPPTYATLDGARMGEALSNVIRNGLDAAGGKGPVMVRVTSDDGALVIEVRDRGPGIAQGDEERVFEPFHSRKVRGTGLGLAIVRRTVALHGGTVTAGNHRDGGALFRITLPEG